MAKQKKKKRKRKLLHIENFIKGCIDFPKKCEDCRFKLFCSKTKLNYYLKIPWVIIDNYTNVLSSSAFKVYIVLSRSANFSSHHKDYGKCYLTYKQISEKTGVAISHMGKYIKELEDKELIKIKQQVVKEATGFKTLNTFNILCHFQIKEIKKINKRD